MIKALEFCGRQTRYTCIPLTYPPLKSKQGAETLKQPVNLQLGTPQIEWLTHDVGSPLLMAPNGTCPVPLVPWSDYKPLQVGGRAIYPHLLSFMFNSKGRTWSAVVRHRLTSGSCLSNEPSLMDARQPICIVSAAPMSDLG